MPRYCLVWFVFIVVTIALPGCDSGGDLGTGKTDAPPAAGPSWVSLSGVRLGTPLQDLRQRNPSVQCDEHSSRCTFPSTRGDIEVTFSEGLVRSAQLKGESFDDSPLVMRKPFRESLYNALVRDLGRPFEELEGADYGGYVGGWRGEDGSELALEIAPGTAFSLPQYSLTLGEHGLASERALAHNRAFDQRLAAMVAKTSTGGVSLAGVVLGEPLPLALEEYCTSNMNCKAPDDWNDPKGVRNDNLQIFRDSDGRITQVDLRLGFGMEDSDAIARSIARLGMLERHLPDDEVLWSGVKWQSLRGEQLEYVDRDGSEGGRLRLMHPEPKSEGFGPSRG